MHRPVYVAHNSFIEGSHTTKNTASGLLKLLKGLGIEPGIFQFISFIFSRFNTKLQWLPVFSAVS
jgi:hypothetical protein